MTIILSGMKPTILIALHNYTTSFICEIGFIQVIVLKGRGQSHEFEAYVVHALYTGRNPRFKNFSLKTQVELVRDVHRERKEPRAPEFILKFKVHLVRALSRETKKSRPV